MKKNILALPLIAFAALLAIAPVTASAAVPAPRNAEQMKALDYLIGTWNCSFSAGGQSGTNVSTFTPVMNGAWLQETEAIRTKSGGLYITTMHYTGYDPDEKRYMHVGPDANGGYEVAYTTDFQTFHTLLPVKKTRPSPRSRIPSSRCANRSRRTASTWSTSTRVRRHRRASTRCGRR